MQFNPANNRGFVTDKPFFGKNPTYGAPISFYLAKAQTNVALRIRDAAGTQVRETHRQRSARCARRPASIASIGILRHQPLAPLAGQPAGGGGGGGGFGGGGNNGPNVLPGEYRVTLVVDGKDVATKSIRVTGDKDAPMTDAERKTWHDTALEPSRHAARGECRGRSRQHAGDAGDRGRSAAEDGGQRRRRPRRPQ